MPVRSATCQRSTLAELYRSDLACWAGVVVIWELLVILVALWVVPTLLSAAATAGPLSSNALVIGAGA